MSIPVRSKRLRFEQVSYRIRESRKPKFAVGERVFAWRRDATGIVVAVYFDFRAAVDSGAVLDSWFDIKKRATPRGGFFYGVLLSAGQLVEQIVEGEDELMAADIGSA